MKRNKIAVCQINCGPDSKPDKNCEKICSYLEQAASADAELVLFPELALSGYVVDVENVLSRCRLTSPEMIEQITSIARDMNIATVVGLLESSNIHDKVYNVSLAISPDGRQTRYRKTHIPPNEGPFAPSDQGTVVADLGFVKLGLSVCFDNWFAETARMSYLAGAEMLHMPFYWPAEWEVKDDIPSQRVPVDDDAILEARRKRMLKIFPSRAIDNAMYIVMIDHAGKHTDLGKHLPGKSMVFDPYGELLVEARGWEEEILYFDFDREKVCEWRKNPFFPGNNLRPDIYIKAFEQYNK
jgi:predicted amidohydrolase